MKLCEQLFIIKYLKVDEVTSWPAYLDLTDTCLPPPPLAKSGAAAKRATSVNVNGDAVAAIGDRHRMTTKETLLVGRDILLRHKRRLHGAFSPHFPADSAKI
jgi:hypothetical protein